MQLQRKRCIFLGKSIWNQSSFTHTHTPPHTPHTPPPHTHTPNTHAPHTPHTPHTHTPHPTPHTHTHTPTQETRVWGGTRGKQQKEQQCEQTNSQTNELLVFARGFSEPQAARRLLILSSIPDRVAGQENQFAEFLQECLHGLSTNEREYLGNVSNVLRGNEPSRPDLETCEVAYELIIGNVGNKVKVLLVFSTLALLILVLQRYC